MLYCDRVECLFMLVEINTQIIPPNLTSIILIVLNKQKKTFEAKSCPERKGW